MPTVYHPTLADVSYDVADDDIAAWHAQGWVDAPPAVASEPPRAGAGSGKQAWVDYAGGRGIEVEDGDTRDAIITKVDAAGARSEPVSLGAEAE